MGLLMSDIDYTSKEKITDMIIELCKRENAKELIHILLIKFEDYLTKKIMIELLNKELNR